MINTLKRSYKGIAFKPVENTIFLIVICISVTLLTTQYYYLALVPAIVIITTTLLGRFPLIGYYLIIFLIPFGAYREIKGINLQWLICLWIIIAVFFHSVFKKRIPLWLNSNLWPWLIIFFFISIISMLTSDYRDTSIRNLPLLLAAIAFVLLNLLFISRKDFCETLPLVIIFSVSIGSLLGMIGYVFNIQLFAENVEIGAFKRCVGATTDPNNFALMVIFNLPLLSYWFFSTRRYFCKLLAVVFFIINITSLMLSFSRGGALIAFFVLLIILIDHRHKFKVKHLGFVLALITIVISAALVFIPPTYWQHQKSLFGTKDKDASIGRRTSYLYVGADAFKMNPVLGSGPGCFGEIFARTSYAREFEKKDQKTLKRYAHNTYLEILVGTGVLGLIIFITVVSLAARNFYVAKKKLISLGNKKMVFIVRSYQLSFISVLVYLFLFSDIYHKYLLLSLSLSQIALRLSKDKEMGGNDENVNDN